MTNCMLAIASTRGLLAAVYVSPITLLACIILVPGGVALAVMSYVYRQADDDQQQQQEQADEEIAPYTRSMSTRRWLAERYVPYPLEGAVLQSIPLHKCTSGMATQMMSSCCVVCLAPFQAAELLKVLPPCQHAFHVACIDRWFESNSTCPICRCHVCAPSENGVALPSHQHVCLDVVVT